MTKRTLYLILCAFLCTSLCYSAGHTPKDIPLVYLQDSTRFVSNPDAILSHSTVAQMDSILRTLRVKTGIQTVVVAVGAIEGGDCFDFAQQLAKISGAGQKGRDNGLVILLSTEERCVQFATGYGLEGALPDAICKRIQTQHMLPRFRENDWDTGMLEGIRATSAYLDGSMENIEEDSGDGEMLFVFLGFIVVGFGLMGFAYWREMRCPKCKRSMLKRISCKPISTNERTGETTMETIMKCPHCGYVKKSHCKVGGNNIGGSSGSGPIYSGGFGGSSRGGGFNGGSFGGGSFGGGGAGSRF